jgi:hypothetical protein
MSPALHPFTQRLLKTRTDRFAHFPPALADPLELAVKDEVLVAEKVAEQVTAFLVKNKLSPNLPPVNELPHTFGDGTAEDVVIVPIQGTNPFTATETVRKQLLKGKQPESVSPNHILIPAPNEDFCPWGPPSPAYGYPTAVSEAGSPGHPVTVIDASYFWNDAKWGLHNNPLSDICQFEVRWAEWHRHGEKNWRPGSQTLLSRNGDPKVLDALTGHANFVAGVVAQGCQQPHITIWSHNGGFPKGSDEYPTEASVCRSIWASQRPAKAEDLPLSLKPAAVRGAPSSVIHVGFAFHPHGGVPSKIWRLTFGRVAALHSPGAAPIIVAPAGNQASSLARYPAAFKDTINPVRVIGVGSVQPGGYARSSFTNYGPWVTCGTVGEDVESTFLHVKMELEEDISTPRLPHDFRGSDWATWNGTSFASPKVTGHLAARLSLSSTLTPGGAWNALTQVSLTGAGGLGVGDYVFDF